MFKLTYEEYNYLRFQFGTSNMKGGRRYIPYVFTEQGVAMLASVLRTKVAASVSVNIMRAFVNMRHFITNSIDVLILEGDYWDKLMPNNHPDVFITKESIYYLLNINSTKQLYLKQIYKIINKIN